MAERDTTSDDEGKDESQDQGEATHDGKAARCRSKGGLCCLQVSMPADEIRARGKPLAPTGKKTLNEWMQEKGRTEGPR